MSQDENQIETQKEEVATLKNLLSISGKLLHMSAESIDYQVITDGMKKLSGGWVVGLNTYEAGGTKSVTRAFSGFSSAIKQASKILGFPLTGKEWDVIPARVRSLQGGRLVQYNSLYETSMGAISKNTAHILERIFNLGYVYVINFSYERRESLGDIIIFMKKGEKIKNREAIEIYADLIGSILMRVRTEKTLRESEAKFRAYMEKSPLGILVANMEGRYIEVNRAACQMSGYTEEELLNLSILDSLTPEFLEKGMKSFERLLAEGYAEDDVMARKRNGETFWINLAAVKIDSSRVIAFFKDITARKEMEERTKELNCLHNFSLLLRKEKNNLEKILEETVELLPPSFQYPEDVGARITLKGREFKTQDYEPTPWIISSSLELYGKQIGTIEVCYRKPHTDDGDLFIKEEKMVLETVAEHLSRVIEQIQSQESLRKSNNQLSITLHSIGDGVIVTDASGKITRLNPRAEKLTGWAAEEALGRALHEVFHIVNAKNGEPVPNPVYRVIKTGRTQGLADDTILVARDGTKRHIADSAAPMRDHEDKMFGVIMVFSDVTERKDAEEFLKYKLGFEIMLADISSTFASQPSEQLEQSINHALEQIGEFFQIERSYVFQFSDDGKQMSNTHEWCAEGTEAQMDRIHSVPVDAFPWLIEQIKNRKHVNIPDVDSLPPEAEAEKKEFKSQDIRSLLLIPMMKNGIVFGFLGLDAVKETKIWTENQVMLLTVVAELMSNAYTRKLAEEKIRYQSFHDGLTGLYNRVYLEKEMERLDTERQLPIGIIMADLNGLKILNDTFGHEAGDEMLKQTAAILRNSCRGEDIIARWGGDEFVIFLPQTTAEDAKAICQRIDEKCKGTYVKEIPLSLALGFAIKSSTSQVLAETLKEAEEIMYKHKLMKQESEKVRRI